MVLKASLHVMNIRMLLWIKSRFSDRRDEMPKKQRTLPKHRRVETLVGTVEMDSALFDYQREGNELLAGGIRPISSLAIMRSGCERDI